MTYKFVDLQTEVEGEPAYEVRGAWALCRNRAADAVRALKKG
tara:strand:+ start:361 stop:486 length:126 start_codon:yes stop_codon:yes gene_type:complete